MLTVTPIVCTVRKAMPLSSRERSQRFRDKIKADADKHSQYLLSERKRYVEQKQKGSRKLIGDLTERGQRMRRKVWRIQQHASRQARKTAPTLLGETDSLDTSLSTTVTTSTATPSTASASTLCPSTTPQHTVTPSTTGNKHGEAVKRSGRKKVRRDRAKAYRTIDALNQQIEKQRLMIQKYRKALQRRKRQADVRNTPKSITRRQLNGSKVCPLVKRTLLFHNVLVHELKEKMSNAKSDKQRQTLSQVVSGKLLKQYKVQNMLKQFGISGKRLRSNVAKDFSVAYKRARTRKAVSYDTVTKIHAFYLREDNSSSTAGKKETVTRKKIKKTVAHFVRLHQKLACKVFTGKSQP